MLSSFDWSQPADSNLEKDMGGNRQMDTMNAATSPLQEKNVILISLLLPEQDPALGNNEMRTEGQSETTREFSCVTI